MKPTDYSERKIELHGWPVNLTSYRLGDVYYCKADNVSPGAHIARAQGASKQEAEEKALAKAKERLAATRRNQV